MKKQKQGDQLGIEGEGCCFAFVARFITDLDEGDRALYVGSGLRYQTSDLFISYGSFDKYAFLYSLKD